MKWHLKMKKLILMLIILSSEFSFATPSVAQQCQALFKANSLIEDYLKSKPKIDIIRYQHLNLTDAEYKKAIKEEELTPSELNFPFESYKSLEKKVRT